MRSLLIDYLRLLIMRLGVLLLVIGLILGLASLYILSLLGRRSKGWTRWAIWIYPSSL